MATRSRSRLLLTLVAPPVIVGYGIHKGLTALETKYPSIPPESSTSVAFRTPQNPETQHCPHIDVYSARVPVSSLQTYAQNKDKARSENDRSKMTSQDLQLAWTRALIGCRILRTEASLVGLFVNGRFTPGDLGDSVEGFSPKTESGSSPRTLLNGIMIVERPPDESDEYGMLLSWKIPGEPRAFFEKIARWGYPWRLMSGGRHEVSISEPFESEKDDEKSKGLFVEVRFSAAHDYEIVPEEGDLQHQKIIPDWTGRLHRGYARLILDNAVRELMKSQ